MPVLDFITAHVNSMSGKNCDLRLWRMKVWMSLNPRHLKRKVLNSIVGACLVLGIWLVLDSKRDGCKLSST